MFTKTICVALLIAGLTPTNQASAKTIRDCPQYHAVLKQYGLPPKVFGPIAYRESRCNPSAVSKPNGDGSIDSGMLQINSSWRSLTARVCKRPANQVIKSLTQLSCNLKVAAVLWQNGKGASNWRVYQNK